MIIKRPDPTEAQLDKEAKEADRAGADAWRKSAKAKIAQAAGLTEKEIAALFGG